MRRFDGPRASDDYFLLADMKACLRRHLNAGLIECAALSRELAFLDADEVMAALRRPFDPEMEMSAVQDAFSDAFAASLAAIKNAGGEPVTAGAYASYLPSGAAAPAQA